MDTLTAGGKQAQNHINESGLYALILGSTKPEAKRFKRWVTSEVLPAIRKTGRYEAPPAKPADKPPTLPNATRDFRAYLSVAKLIGLKGNQAVLSANRATRNLTGRDLLAELDARHLKAENGHTIELTPTDFRDAAKKVSAPSRSPDEARRTPRPR